MKVKKHVLGISFVCDVFCLACGFYAKELTIPANTTGTIPTIK
jgi:hypothetical protein